MTDASKKDLYMVRQFVGGLHEIVKPAPVAGFAFIEIKLFFRRFFMPLE